MNEDERELLKIGAEVALRPGTELIENIIGALGGDALRDYRQRQYQRRQARHAELSMDAARLLQDRHIKEPVEPNAAAVDELAEAAQDEPREELRKLWVKLLAAMFDPARAPSFRREFIEIAKQLEPLDAAVLPMIVTTGQLPPSRREYAASQTGSDIDAIDLAFRNLVRLELAWQPPGGISSPMNQPITTPLGRKFLAAVV